MEKDYSASIDKVLSAPTTEKVTGQKDYSKSIDAVLGQSQDNNSIVKANLYQASNISPDAAVKQFKINQATKLPIDTVRREQKSIEQQYEYSKLASSVNDLPPKLRETLHNPALAPVIKDDLEGLSWFEKYSTTTFNQPTDAEKAEQQRIKDLPLYERIALDYEQNAALGTGDKDVAIIKDKELWGGELSAIEQNRLEQIKTLSQTDYQIPFLLGSAGAARRVLPTMVDALTSKTAIIPALVGGGVQAVKEAAVFGGAAAVAGAVTGPVDVPITIGATIAGGAKGFAKGFGKTYSISSAVALSRQQAALSYADYQTMTDFEGNPISPTIARGAAIVNGVASGLLERVGAGILLKNFPGGEALMGKLSKEGIATAIKSDATAAAFARIGKVVESAGAEGATEFLQSVAQDVVKEFGKMASGDEYKPFEQEGDIYGWLAGVFERASEQGKMGVQAGIGIASAGQAISAAASVAERQYQQVKDRKAFNTLVNETALNKTFQRDPQAWEAATANDLGQKQVHVNADSLREFFQSGLKVENAAEDEQALTKDTTPKSLEEFLALIPNGQEQYNEAIQYGGNMILPANSVISVLAQHEGLRSMEEFIKINPDALSDDQYTTDMLNRILPEINEFEKAQTVENLEGVTKAFESQLLNAGETPDSAKHIAALFNARYQKLAQTTENPDILNEIKNVFKLEIRNQDRQERLQNVNKIEDIDLQLDALRKPQGLLSKIGLGGKKINPRTQPLLSFLKDKGGVQIGSTLDGELRAMGITPKTNPGLFKKGKGVTDVDNFEQSLIQQQLGESNFVLGEGEYADRDFILEQLGKEAFVETQGEDTRGLLEHALDEYGLDINTMSNEEIKKALKDIAGTDDLAGYFQDPKAYDSAGDVKTESEAFKNWFGNSKVVDENGKPLVVYHGTNQNFDSFSRERFGQNTAAASATEFFFTENSAEAAEYANMSARKQVSNAVEREANSERLLAEIAKAEKRGDWDKSEALYLELEESENEALTGEERGANIIPVYLSVQNPKIISFADGFDGYELSKEIKKAKEQGFDGLKLENVYDPVGERPELFSTTQWVVFEPTQIKSVNNRGTFDVNNPNILYQAPVAEIPETAKQVTQDATDLTGITANPLEAGFITYDGKMLNLNGKRGEGEGQRTTDHSAIAKQLGYEDTEKKDALYNFQKASQVVRVDFNAGLVSANFVPNDKQINAIVKAAKDAGIESLAIDYADLPNKIHSYAYVDNINARNIKRVFNEDLNGETLYQSAPEFYSALQRNIEALPQGKGDANQWKGIVKNLTQKGVKQEEIDWLGLNDWLDQQTGSVTKQQVLDYIAANQVQVSESVKGGDSPYRKFVKSLSDKYGDDWINKMTPEEEIKKEELFADDYEESKFLDTRFGKYVLPGGENYKELLITLPTNTVPLTPTERKDYEELKQKYERQVMRPAGWTWDDALSGEESERLGRYNQHSVDVTPDNYKSSHYSEPNIVAHLRFNERKDADGKKVLFVEEIQSDWHQEGRKKGYKVSNEELNNLTNRKIEIEKQVVDNNWNGETTPADVKAEWLSISNKLSEAGFAVPDAPFKTSWAELSFKRALMWAVEHGFDKVAWTTGEQQAERYDLSKQVDELIYRQNPDGTFEVSAITGGRGNLLGSALTASQLEDYVGKEVATKISNQEGQKRNLGGGGVSQQDIWTSLSGDGLKVGGEGMKGFYDKILPSMVNKLTKKWGGKVEATTIATGGGKPTEYADFDAWMAAKEGQESKVHSLEITPAMRESIQKGLPLFQNNTPAEAPRGSFVFGGSQGSVINIFKGRDKSTVLHELMHFFLEVDKHLLNKFGVELSPESKQTFEGLSEWWTSKASDIQRIAAKADDTYRVSGTVVTDMMGRSLNFATVAEAEKYAADKTKELQEQVKALSAEDIKTMANNFLSNPKSPLEALFNREFHEYAARGFERYLREGKAPSKTLRQAFRNFKAWLLRIYKDIKQLNVQLDDDVRDTFDRMLASDEEIDAMRNELLFRPDKQIMDNLSATEKKDYVKRTENEIARAKEKLLTKLLKDAEKKHAKWYVDERAKVRAEVEGQVNQFPVYRATHFLKTGKFLDKPTPEDVAPFKMNIKNVRENYQYGNEIAARLPRGLTARDGLNPETVATMFDFESAEAMFKTMLNMQDRNKVIDQETDRLMIERHGDALTDGTLEREVLDAMHNTDRASKIAYEISVINRKTGFKGVNKEQFRLKAYDIIQDKQSSKINAGQYYTSEVHAAREAGKYLAKKDYVKAAEWKGKQLLNHYLYQEGRLAEKTRDRTYKLFDKILDKDKKLSKSRNMDLVNGARALLAKYNYTRSGLDINMVMAQIQQYDPQTYERLMAAKALVEAPAKNYNKLTVSELAEVRNGVENMFNLSREEFITDATGKKRTVAETRDALVTRLREVYATPEKQKVITTTSEKEKTMRGILSVMAGLRVTESWTSEMDDNDIDGIFSTTTSRPIQNAVVAYRAELERQMGEYADLFKELQKETPRKEFRKAIPAPELTDAKGVPFEFRDKWELLHAILHTGNNSNKNKLVAGYGWGEKQPDGIVNMNKWNAFVARMENEGVLTKADYVFAQGVWDLMEKGKPLAQKAHKAQFGYYFNEITAEPVVTKFGIFRGGYIPAIIDPTKTPDIGDKQDIAEIMNSSAVAFTYPAPTKGFTISRNENFARPLQLDIRILGAHLDKVLRFAYLSEPVSNVAKLYMHGSLKNNLDGINQGLVKHMIVPWLKRTAQQTVQERGAFATLDKIATTIRQRAGQAIMTLNISNGLQQATGLVVASAMVNKGKLAAASASYGVNPSGFLNDIYEKSDFLRLRATNQSFGLHNDINKLILDKGTWENIKTFGANHSYIFQRFMQNAVDGIVWQAAFDDSTESGKEFKSAVAHADSIVRQTQGSFEAQDISTVMSGTPFTKLFTQFMPYFNMLYNLNLKETRRIMRDVGYAGAPELFYLYITTISLPAILSTAIVMTLADAWDDEESPWMKLLVNSQVSTIANAVPLLGNFVNYGLNLVDDKAYNDKFSISPAFDMTAGAIKAVTQLTKENASAKPIITNGLNGLQIMTGQPVGFLGRPLGYIAAVQEGKENPSGPADVARGLITGKGNND